jgi:hypothetical protein
MEVVDINYIDNFVTFPKRKDAGIFFSQKQSCGRSGIDRWF